MVSTKPKPKPPRNASSSQDLRDSSPQPRVASGSLTAQAAQAPEFVPSEEEPRPTVSDQHVNKHKGDQKTSDTGSDKDKVIRKKAAKKLSKKLPKAEHEARQEALRQEALRQQALRQQALRQEALRQQAWDEEWWSADEVFVPDLKNKEDLWDNGKD